MKLDNKSSSLSSSSSKMENNNQSNCQINNNNIAIVGIGLRLPGGSKTPQQLWQQLLNGFDGITVVPKDRWSMNYYQNEMINNKYGGFLNSKDWKTFDPLFFGISPKEAPFLDPQQKILLQVVWESLEDAFIKPDTLRGSNTGVFIGASTQDYMKLQFKDLSEQSPYSMTGTNTSILSNRISYSYDFRGPSFTLDTACSSSLVAVQLACQSILTGDCNVALAGGVNALLDPSTSVSFSSLGVLNPEGRCKTFDKDAGGYVRSEGAGVVVLKRLDLAERDNDRIYGVILGGSINEDGSCNKTSLTTPSCQSQSKNIETALNRSNISPKDIYYVEAHGTGTPVGDPIEAKALGSIFAHNHSPEAPLKVGSIKSNIGHLESAAGIASLIKVCLMLKNRCLVPNIHFNEPNPNIPFDKLNLQVVQSVEPFPENQLITMGINNFGFGGSNCHVVVREYFNSHLHNNVEEQVNEEDVVNQKQYIIPFSANSDYSLTKYEQEIRDNSYLFSSVLKFKEFAQYQSTSKTHLSHRKVSIASDWHEWLEGNYLSTSNNLTSWSDDQPTVPVCFVFAGQGPQWNKMGLELYKTQPVYRDMVDKCDAMLSKYFGYSVWQKVISLPDDSSSINSPILAQPALFLLQVGLVSLYKHWGIEPDLVIGHSFGEVTSALCSGSISLESAIKIVYYRSYYQNLTIGTGKMLACSISESVWLEKYQSLYPKLEVACYNAPESLVITGEETILKEFANVLTHANIFNAFLKSPCSFHSSHQKMIKKQVLESLADLPPSVFPMIPLFSTVYGDLQTKPINADYVYKNLRKPVMFQSAIQNIVKYMKSNHQENIVFLEITPHPTLAYLINKCANGIGFKVVSSLNRGKDELQTFNLSLASLYCNGVDIDFSCQFKDNNQPTNNNNCEWKEVASILPRYQWENDVEYWNESLYSQDMRLKGPPTSLLGYRSHFNGLPSYQTIIDVKKHTFAYLKDHKVKGKSIFPGAGYIDIIYNSLGKQSQDYDINIQSLEFQSPFFLLEGEQQLLETVMDETSKNQFRVQFYQKDSQNVEKWNKTCQARVELVPKIISKPKESIDRLINDNHICSIGKEELYQMIIKLGLTYGDHFQRIQHVYIGQDKKRSIARLDIEGELSHSSSILNAMVLDNCFHGLLGLLETNQHFVMEKVNDMHVYNTVAQDLDRNDTTLYLMTDLESVGTNSAQGSCRLMTERGEVILEMNQFVVKALDKKKELKLKDPYDDVYTIHWQTKEAPLPLPSTIAHDALTDHFDKSQILMDADFIQYCYRMLKSSLISNFNENIMDIITSSKHNGDIKSMMKELAIPEKEFLRFFTRIVQILTSVKDSKETIENLRSKIINKYTSLSELELTVIEKATNVVPQLFKGDSSSCHTLFENGLLSKFYTSSLAVGYYLEQLSLTIQQTVFPLLKEQRIFKILEIGAGTGSLTYRLLDKLLKISSKDQPLQIEYTFTDVSQSFVNDIKEDLLKFVENSNISIVFKTLNIEKDLEQQSFLTNNYDIIVMSYVIHAVSNLKYSIGHLNRLLVPNGWLLFIEPFQNIVFSDIVFGCFHQWWEFSDTETRTQHCSITPQEWYNLLVDNGFKEQNVIVLPLTTNQQQSHSFIVHCQKQTISRLQPTITREDNMSSVIILSKSQRQSGNSTNTPPSSPIITSSSSSLSTSTSSTSSPSLVSNSQSPSSKKVQKYLKDINIYSKNVEIMESEILDRPSMDQEKQIIEMLQKSTFVLNFSGLDTLNGNYKTVTYELVKLIQLMDQAKTKAKLIVITKMAQRSSRNYLNASLIGVARTAMNEYPHLDIITIDIEDEETTDLYLMLKLAAKSNVFCDREYIIKRGGITLVPRLYHNTQPLKPSIAYETNESKLYCSSTQELSFQFKPLPMELLEDQVEIQVEAVGINFKDNLFYKGLLPQEIFRKGDIYNPPFGLECSGIVTRVGPLVNSFEVGDQVFGFARHSLASHVVTKQSLLVKKPANITHQEAASIPVVYCTAYYALFKVAHLDPSTETSMIHSATGGVGLAALNLIKMMAPTKKSVQVTVGSKEKKQYLERIYGDIIQQIHSSRTKEYSEIGNKVDCLLNTLSGEYTYSNFKSMASFGRIVDLSVTHIYANEPVDLGNFKRDILYSSIDLERVIDEKPILLQRMLLEISNWISEGKLEKIPVENYDSSNVKAAIDYMNERRHIGKIVVTCSNLFKQQLELKQQQLHNQPLKVPKDNYTINLDSTVIVTGQTGMSIQIIQWLLHHSQVSNIMVLSKSNLRWRLQYIINHLASSKSFKKIHFIKVDVSLMEPLTKLVKDNLAVLPPVRAVFHLAAIYNDVEFSKVTLDNISSVHDPKVMGAVNLHRLSIILGWKLKQFIMFSSITAVTGYNDQTSYNSANAVLDAISNFRKHAGLPSLAINWGPLQGEGKVADNEAIAMLFANRGLPSLSLSKFIGALESACNGTLNSNQQVIISPIDTNLYFDSFKHMRPKMEHLKSMEGSQSSQSSSSASTSLDSILDNITNKVSNLLSIGKSKINSDTKLKDYGLDSLLTVQFKGWIDKEYEKNLFSHIQLSGSSINGIVEKIIEKIGGTFIKQNNNNQVDNNNKNISSSTTTTTTTKEKDNNNVEKIITTFVKKPTKLLIQEEGKSPISPLLSSSNTPSLIPSMVNELPSTKTESYHSGLSSPNQQQIQPPTLNIPEKPKIQPLALNRLSSPRSSLNSPNSARSTSSNISSGLNSPIGLYSMVSPNVNNNSYILGIGTSVPNEPLPQKELGEVMSLDFSDDPNTIEKVKKIFEQSQIKTRYLYRNPLKHETALKHRKGETINEVNKQFVSCAPNLAKEACKRAIKDWGGNVSDITHIVSVSSTGVVVPDINFLMIQELGLNQDVERVSINFMGCLAGLSSMRTANSLACHHSKNRVLVVCTEICSTHFTTKEGVDQIVASSIFADGSAAYVIGCQPNIFERPLFEVLATLNRAVPNTAETMTWNISTDGWDLGLDQSIPHHIGSGVEPFVSTLLDKVKSQIPSSQTIKDYEFLVHTGGKAILMALENSLGIDQSQNKHTWDIYRNYGNMSSASVIFVMDKARHSSTSLPQYSVSLAFGPGLGIEGVVFKNI